MLADTHNRLPHHVVAAIRDADEIWHLGDVVSPSILDPIKQLARPLRVVRGNCDDSPDWALALSFELEGSRIMLVHEPPRWPPPEIGILLHGHTHIPRDEVIDGTRFLNPGCITRPSRGAPASYAWLELQCGAAPCWALVRV